MWIGISFGPKNYEKECFWNFFFSRSPPNTGSIHAEKLAFWHHAIKFHLEFPHFEPPQ